MTKLKEYYLKFMNTSSEKNINWEEVHVETKNLIESILNSETEEFVELANSEIENDIFSMPPWVLLLGYKKAVLETPKNISYFEGLLFTYKWFYSENTKVISELENQIGILKSEHNKV